MNAKPFLLKETNWKTVKDINYKIAILPWGATEAHNYHLPFGTDIFEAEYFAEQSAKLAWNKGVKIIALPTIPFGVNIQQLDIRLTINMNPSTQFKILEDVIESLEQHGVEKFVILNSHGGNDFKHMIRVLQKKTKIFISLINWYTIGDKKDFFEVADGDHADEMETSLMLHVFPELVLPLEEAGDGASKKIKLKAIQEKWAWAPREWTKVTSDTGIGNPKAATAEKGERYSRFITEKIVQYFCELSEINLSDMYE